MGRPASVRGKFYDSPLATNIRALAQRYADGMVSRYAKDRGLPVSTINRIASGSIDCGLAMLQTISEATEYSPSQLIDGRFDPAKSPPMMRPDVAWVATRYAEIKSPIDRARAQAIIEQFLDVPAPSVDLDTTEAQLAHR